MEDVKTGSGGQFKVYSSFWKALNQMMPPGDPEPAPRTIPAPAKWPKSETLAEWDLLPTKPDWSPGFGDWTPGEAQALAMITINPARELGLEDRLGSIEVGKDGDIVLFNAHPFDAFSRCELALIDGEVYFQRREPGGKMTARPGDHSKMPQAVESARARAIEVATQPKGVFALVGATIHQVAGPEIPAGTVIVAGGKIEAVGPAASVRIPPEAQR